MNDQVKFLNLFHKVLILAFGSIEVRLILARVFVCFIDLLNMNDIEF